MLTIALTGGIGTGKSEVSKIFASLGTPVIDTDIISRQLVTPGSTALRQITDQLGTQFLLDDGNLDRQKMRELVFNDEKARKILENILHPLIQKEVQHQLSNLKDSYAIIVIPLLVETGQQSRMDRVLLIDTTEALQRERVMSRDDIDQELFDNIIASQASRQERQAIADDIILNDSNDLKSLQQKITDLHEKYLRLARDTIHS